MRKANTAISRSLRAVIRTTMAAYEGKLLPQDGRALHKALLNQVAAAQLMREEAAKQKQERLERHFELVESEPVSKPPRGRKRTRSSTRKPVPLVGAT